MTHLQTKVTGHDVGVLQTSIFQESPRIPNIVVTNEGSGGLYLLIATLFVGTDFGHLGEVTFGESSCLFSDTWVSGSWIPDTRYMEGNP